MPSGRMPSAIKIALTLARLELERAICRSRSASTLKAGRSVYFTPLSDFVSTLAKAEREAPCARR